MKPVHVAFAALVAVASFGATRTLTGCAKDSDSEIVVGVSTQMRTPREVAFVRVRLEPQGAPATCQVFDLAATPLPQAVHAHGGSGSGLLVATVEGFQAPPPADCFDSTGVVVSRRARTHFVSGSSLYLSMPLRHVCTNVACGDGQTCRGGPCQSDAIDEGTLVDYEDSLLFGTTSFCIPRNLCLNDRVPALPLDDATCTFQFTADVVLSKGINVELVQDDLSREVVDLDPVEGFTIDATQPDRFRLSDALCTQWRAHKISAISIGVGCPWKTPLAPMCMNEPVDAAGLRAPAEAEGVCTSSADLPPSKSAIYLLLDRSHSMGAFFGPDGDSLHEKLGLALASPLLRNAKAAMRFLPDFAADCVTDASSFANPYPPLGVPMNDANINAAAVDAFVADPSVVLANDPPLYLDAALRPEAAYAALARVGVGAAVPKRELLFLGNRDVTGHCEPSVGLPNEEAFAVSQNAGLHTGAIVLRAPSWTNQGGRDPYIDAVTMARAGGGPFFDATFDPSIPETAIASSVADLGLCLYDMPPGLTEGVDFWSTSVSYFNPLSGDRADVHFAPDCSETSNGDGWNVDLGQGGARRLRICGKPCIDLGVIVKAGAIYAIDHHVPPPDLPVKWAPLCK